MTRLIEFFWEPGSSYTYLASTQIEALARECDASITYKPFLLGKVFEARGMKLPASIPAKAKYMFTDLARWAQQYEIPFVAPQVFPVHSLLASRCAIAAGEADAGRTTRAICKAYWGEGRDISQPHVLQAAFDAAGLDGAAILARTQDAEVKDTLKRNTEEALERGVFGAPTLFVGEAMFWGNDRLDHLRMFLQDKLAA